MLRKRRRVDNINSSTSLQSELSTGVYSPIATSILNVSSILQMGSSAVVKLASGTYGAPALTFVDEATLGFYRLNTGQLGIAACLKLDTFTAANDGAYNGALSIASKDDPDTGLNWVTGGGGTIELISQNNRIGSFNGTAYDMFSKLRLPYGSGTFSTAPIGMRRSNGALTGYMFIDSNDAVIIQNTSGSGDIRLIASAGNQIQVESTEVITQPPEATSTTCDYSWKVGDGVSSFTTLCLMDELSVDFSIPVNINYQTGGTTQLAFETSGSAYDVTHAINASDHYLIHHNTAASEIRISTTSTGAIKLKAPVTCVRSATAANTDVEFSVQKGNGATFDNVIVINEVDATFSVPIINEDGEKLNWVSSDITVGSADINDSVNAFTGISGSGHYGGSSFTAGATDFLHGYCTAAWTGKGSATGDIVFEPSGLINLDSTAAANVPVLLGQVTGINVSGRLSCEIVVGTNEFHFFNNPDNGSAPTRLQASSFSTSGSFTIMFTYPTLEV